MKIEEGLCVLELGSEERRMNATLIWDDNDVVLIDAGLPGQLQGICKEMDKAGVSFDKINRIILTHHDLDHIGSLASVINNSKNSIEVLTHLEEKPYIEGEKAPIKFTPERLASMPEDKRNEIIEQMKGLKAKINGTIVDDEELPYCGGISVIHTPGHTHGHTCLYLKKYKTLVTGDALNVVNGELIGPKPEYTLNMNQAVNSLKKLFKYDIKTVICYHGGVFTNNPNEIIAKLAEEV